MNESYKRNYQNNYLYIVAEGTIILGMAAVNMMNHALLNLFVWILIAGMCPYVLYYEDNRKNRRILECEALALCISVCESLGAILLHWILQSLQIVIKDSELLYCLEVTFSKVVLIFLYYVVIYRLRRKMDVIPSKEQYAIYITIFIYSLVNMLLITAEFMQKRVNYLWAANMGCIVLADLCLLYFVKISNENKFFENQVKALTQQAYIQHEYYLLQSEKYNGTLQILHDVNKHIKMIENLYMTNKGGVATEYLKQINDILKPLIPVEYTGNPILDILLADKKVCMNEKGIDFRIEVDHVDLTSIESIDITTIFGNLLDNAIAAAEQSPINKYVHIKINSYYQMIVVKIENGSCPVRWKYGVPVSKNGKNRGIGLLNVKRSVEKYDGDIKLKWENHVFIVEMFLNT